jgi:hypothetical protein
MNMRGKAQLEVFGPTAPRFEERAVIKLILTHFRAVGPATAACIAPRFDLFQAALVVIRTRLGQGRWGAWLAACRRAHRGICML